MLFRSPTCAFALASKAAARFPESAQVLAWLGFQLQFAGRYEDAKLPLRRAIALDPAFPVALQVLGEVFLKQENYTEAVVWLERACALLPEDTEILLALGRAQSESGDTARSLKTLELAAHASPKDARIRFQLSRLYFRLGNEVRAREEAELSQQLRDAQPAVMSPPIILRRR